MINWGMQIAKLIYRFRTRHRPDHSNMCYDVFFAESTSYLVSFFPTTYSEDMFPFDNEQKSITMHILLTFT